MRRRGRASARRDLSASGKRFEEIAADDPEDVDVAGGRVVDHLGRRPPARSGDREFPDVAPARGRGRIDHGPAADFGAALDAGMAADGDEAAVGAARQSAREADVDERLDGLDAVRVLREAHRPDEHGIRLVDEQARERVHLLARRAALLLERVQSDASARSRASSKPAVRSRTNASSIPPISMSARSVPTRNARSPPVCTANQ